MKKRRYIKQEWRKNWKYLQEKLPITTGWITDGVSDDITNKEVTEEIMGLLEKAREEGRREVYAAIVFDKNIPHDVTTFVAAHLWKNMRDKAKEELSKLTTK